MKRLPEETAADRIDAAARTAAGAIGGALVNGTVAAVTVAASLAYALGFIATPLQRRRDAWLVELAAALKDLEARVGKLEDLESNDAFLDVVFAAIPIAMRAATDQKRRALRNAIVNAGLSTTPGDAKQRMFVRMVDELDEIHVDLLQFLAAPGDYLKAKKGMEIPSVHGRIFEALGPVTQLAFRGAVDLEVLALALQQLVQKNLAIFNADVQCHPQGNNFVTPLGLDFLRFVSPPA